MIITKISTILKARKLDFHVADCFFKKHENLIFTSLFVFAFGGHPPPMILVRHYRTLPRTRHSSESDSVKTYNREFSFGPFYPLKSYSFRKILKHVIYSTRRASDIRLQLRWHCLTFAKENHSAVKFTCCAPQNPTRMFVRLVLHLHATTALTLHACAKHLSIEICQGTQRSENCSKVCRQGSLLYRYRSVNRTTVSPYARMNNFSLSNISFRLNIAL